LIFAPNLDYAAQRASHARRTRARRLLLEAAR